MKRLLLSTKALWHQWRALQLARRARALLDASDTHAAEATMSLLASRTLARAPLPSEGSGAGEPRASEPSLAGGCSFAGQVLLGSIVGLAITFLWVWISARAGR